MKSLPPVEVQFPEWRVDSRQRWRTLSARTKRVRDGVGTGPDFERLVTELQTLAVDGGAEAVAERLTNPRAARALVTAWSRHEDAARATMTPELVVGVVDAHGERVPLLLAEGLMALYLQRFDELDDWADGLFAATAKAVHAAATRASTRSDHTLVAAYHANLAYLGTATGPRDLARKLMNDGHSLDDHLRETGIAGHDNGRFGTVARQAYYLEQLRRADHTTAEDSFLIEVTSDSVMRARGSEGLLFGHEVLDAMISDREGLPSDAWLGRIFHVAGDPRLEHTLQWQRWWAKLPPRVLDVATAWLSAEDLRLFLQAVENFGEETHNAELQRMFPARKKFLWGLYESGLVRRTRLILGSKAHNSIRRAVGPVRTSITPLNGSGDSDRAVIFVDCGSFHLVEGSHNFKLWIYDGEPVSRLVDRQTRINGLDLRTIIPTDHARRHPWGSDGHKAIPHNGLWQARALEYLVETLGVALEPHRLLTSADYAELKLRGLPRRHRRS